MPVSRLALVFLVPFSPLPRPEILKLGADFLPREGEAENP